MNREKVQAAVDDAFLDGIKRMFGVMVSNLTDPKPDDADAMSKFRAGVQIHVRAYQDASDVVTQQFPPE
jgi:hypothetical protein